MTTRGRIEPESASKASATMPWWEVEVELPARHQDAAAEALFEAGAAGVQTIDDPAALPPGDARRDRTFTVPGAALVIGTWVSSAGEPDPTAAALEGRARGALAGRVPALASAPIRVVHHTGEGEDGTWAERWKAFFPPQAVGERLWVIPAWEVERFEVPAGGLPVVIDPGMAFGTGQHATTSLCLRLLERCLPQGAAVLDVGTGSGILAIAALRLGAGSVLGIDNDPEAVRAARENVALNDVDRSRIAICDTPVGEVEGRFAFVVANILAHVLCDLAEALLRRVAGGGRLVLSGLLVEQEGEVLEAYRRARARAGEASLVVRERLVEGDWVALLLG